MDFILNSVGLTDKNITFVISDAGFFNEHIPYGHDQNLALHYRTTLTLFQNAVPSVVLS